MIATTDLAGADDLALRVLTVARTIAPNLDTLTDSSREAAIAILRGVLKEAAVRGARGVSSQRTGPSSVNYRDAESWFTADDRAALRALCGLTGDTPGPIGHFPLPAGPIGRLWPGETY